MCLNVGLPGLHWDLLQVKSAGDSILKLLHRGGESMLSLFSDGKTEAQSWSVVGVGAAPRV